MTKQYAVQDGFLKKLQAEGVMLTVFLMNGFQIRGTICGYDPFTVVVMSEGKQNMIYKHAISTITPQNPIQWEVEPS